MATGILMLFCNAYLVIAIDSDLLGQFTLIPIKLLNLT